MTVVSISCPDPACNGSGQPILMPIGHYRCSTCGLVFDLKPWGKVTTKDLEEADGEISE